jgi:hypothetical protein
MRRLWARSMRLWYGQDADGGYASSHYVHTGGEQGEQIRVRGNHFRSLGRRLLIMATESRPAFECTTRNDSAESLDQAVLGQLVIDYYLDDGKLEERSRACAELSLLCGISYLHEWWDPSAGEIVEDAVDVDAPEREMRTGDVAIESLGPIDVARDLRAPSGRHPQWLIVRRWVNRWDVAARLEMSGSPESMELARRVRTYTPESDVSRDVWGRVTGLGQGDRNNDWVPELTMYHASTGSMRAGRQVSIIGDVVTFDGGLPYQRIPVIEMRPCDLHGTPWGYSDLWDLISLQEGYDAALSSMVSAQQAAGLHNLLVARSQQVSPGDIAEGLRLVEWTSDGRSPPPSWLAPPPLPASAVQLHDVMKSIMEVISGINGVARGEVGSEASGAHAALVQSMAIQYASGLVGSYASMLREASLHIIQMLQRFATEERTLALAGSDEASAVRTFRGSMLGSIRQIRTELASPQMRTIAGRSTIARELVEMFPGQVSPEQYLTFLSSGRFEPLYKAQRKEVTGLREETARLTRGEPVKTLFSDHHMEHIREHAAILANSTARFDDALVERVGAHILEHAKLLMSTPPEILEATGQRMPAMAAPPPGGAPPGEPGAERAAPEMGEAAPPGVPLPVMPENPMTGERAPADGGVQP